MRTFLRPLRALPLVLVLACATDDTSKEDTDTDSLVDSDTETQDDVLAVPVVSFENTAPTTTDDLVAVLANASPGATYIWRWTQVAGGPATARTEFDDLTTVPAAATRKGETWRVSVVGTRGDETTTAGTAEVVVQNTPPVATVVITPDPATAADDLVAVVESTDADGDEVGLAVRWAKNGTPTSFQDLTLAAVNLTRDERWEVTVTPTDEEGAGLPVTDDIIIANSPPVVTGVQLTAAEAPPRTRTRLTASAEATDPDGDRVSTITFTWFVNGTQVASGTSTTIADTFYAKGDQVWFEVTARDQSGATSAPVKSNTLRISNTAPRIDLVTLTPSEGDVRTTFTCGAVGWDDDDGDPENLRYSWEVGGDPIPGQTTATLVGTAVVKRDALTCTATPDDGNDLGLPVTSNTVVLKNAPPAVTSVTIGPLPLQVGTAIVATPAGVGDPDGDAVTLRYAWTIDGVAQAAVTGDTLVAGFEPGDLVSVSVTPTDAEGLQGATVSDGPQVVRNRLPRVTEVTLLPSPMRTNSVAQVTSTALDDDGQDVTVTYRWRVNNVKVREVADVEGDGDTLDGSFFVKGDAVEVTALPSDGSGPFGTPRTAGPVTVANTPPVALRATISPSDPKEGSTLTCTASGFIDADGDPEGYVWRWTVDDRLLQTPTNQLTGVEFDKGDDVACIAIPWDGTDQGTQVPSLQVRVGNTPPTLGTVTIGPQDPGPFDVLSATITGAADVDRADTVTYRYRWTVNGEDEGTGATLSGSAWLPGQAIQLFVRPWDGTDEGPEIASNVVVAGNAKPIVLGVQLSPPRPRTGDPIRAVATTFDADGDPLTVTWSWAIDGVTVPGAVTDTLDPVHTTRGDLVTATATARDPVGEEDSGTSAPLEVVNTRPTLAGAAIDPATLTEASVASCVPSGFSDADGDPEQVRVSWYRDGARILQGGTLDGSRFDKGHRITCQAEPFDGDPAGAGPAVTSPAIIVGNSPPTLAGVVLSDPAPDANTEVSVVPGVIDDLDPADSVVLKYRWLVNGSQVSVGAKLSSDHFVKGDEIQAAVRPNDGTADGAEVFSDVGLVQNTAPEVLGAFVGPSGATQTDTLVLDVVADDPDGDSLGYEVTWFVDGLEVASGADLLTLDPGPFTTGSVVTAEVVPNDGEVDGDPFLSDPLLIGNAPPSITTVVVAPLPVTENSVLTCTPSGWNDTDGDPPGYLYRWLVNGVVRSANPTLDGRSFNRGDSVVCRVIPTDGFSTGAPVDSAPAVVQNTPPTFSSAVLSRSSPREADIVSVVLSGVNDVDGDTVATTYQWFVGGVEVATTGAISGAFFDKGQQIYAVVTLSDGTASIQATTNTTTAANTPPSIVSFLVAPVDPLVTQDVVVTTTTSDPDPVDQGRVTVRHDWSVSGAPVALLTGNTLPSGNFTKNDTIRVAATPNDGTSDGTPFVSELLEARNSVPRVTGVHVTPDDPSRATGAECVLEGYEDDDGDGVLSFFQWTVDETPGPTTATLGASSFERGNVLRCAVTLYDGEEYGAAVSSDPVEAVNAPPTIASVLISPQPVREPVVPTAQVIGVEDLDGDVVTWLVTWYVDGANPFVSPNIDGTRFARGQTLRAEAVPNDGYEDGAVVSSETITVANTPPVVVGPIQVTPASINAATAVSASVGGTDADGDSITMRWTFLVNGVVKQEGWSNTLQPGTYRRDDVLQVRATPWDGTVFGAPLSTTGSIVENTVPTKPTISVSPTNANPGVDNATCTLTGPSTDPDGDTLTYQFRWLSGGVQLTRSPSSATSDVLDKSFIGEGEIWQCDARAYDGITGSDWSDPGFVTGRYPYLKSCTDHRVAGGTTSGVYRVDQDGRVGSSPAFDVWCDQTTGGGGWVRILRTDGQDEDYGQRTYNIVSSFAGVTASRGVYGAFRDFADFREVMIKAVTGAQAGRWRSYVLTLPTGLSMLDYLEGCRDEGLQLGNDTWFDVPKTDGHTFNSSGSQSGGDLLVYPSDGSAARVPTRMFVCGVNTSADNDVSYLAFSDAFGWENDWGDGWRGLGQKGTVWSFANGDYCCGGNTHIGAPGLQTLAGWKGQAGTQAATMHAGTYEIYVR